MKTLKLLLGGLVLSSSLTAVFGSQPAAVIKIDLQHLSYSFPAHSFTQMLIPVK